MSEAILTSSDAADASGHWPRWRVVLIRIWAGLLTGLALVMAQGIARIGSAGADERFIYASSTLWKLLSLGGVAFILWTGGRNVAAYWAVAVGQLVWCLAGILAPQADGSGALLGLVNLTLFYGPLIVLRPRRRELLRPQIHPSRSMLVIALLACIPLMSQATGVHRYVNGEPGFDMTGLYLILAAMAVFAALRPHGGTLLGPAVGAAAVLTGLAAIAYPHDVASAGTLGGTLLVIGGFIFAWLSSAPHGRGPVRRREPAVADSNRLESVT